MNHGGNLMEIWGSVMRVRGSQKFVGMRTLKKADKRYDREGGICILHQVKRKRRIKLDSSAVQLRWHN